MKEIMNSESQTIRNILDKEALWMGGRLLVLHHAPEYGSTAPSVSESWVNVGQGPEESRHTEIEFVYFLLEGHMTFSIEGTISELHPGDMAFVPRGARHTNRVNGPIPARVLILTTPGWPWVKYVRAIGTPACASTMPPSDFKPVPMEYIKRLATANGFEFTGPRLPGASRSGHD